MADEQPGRPSGIGPRRPTGPARHEVPEIDARALALARQVERSVAALRSAGRARWLPVLEPLLDPLRDGSLGAVRLAANRVRAAFGVGESVAEDLPDDEARALREATDATLRAIARFEARVVARAGGDTLRQEG